MDFSLISIIIIYRLFSSVSMATKTLSRLCHGAPLDEGYMQVTPPAVHSVIPLCKVGNDDTGNKLISLLEKTGDACRNVVTKYVKNARKRDSHARTALAVLPIYQDGRRGCFFDAASNDTFGANDMVEMIEELASGSAPPLNTSHLSKEDLETYRKRMRVDQSSPPRGAFLFGYPHLLPMMQGENLAIVFSKARASMEDGGIIVMDLNGVPDKAYSGESLRTVEDLKQDKVIGAALPHVDILHMNEDELVHLTGCSIKGTEESKESDEDAIAEACALFLSCGVAVIAVTRGSKGCYIACNDEQRFARSKMLPSAWVDNAAKVNAMELPEGTVINTNGAGDSFTSGLLIAAMLRHTGMTVPVRNSDQDSQAFSDQKDDIDLFEVSQQNIPSLTTEQKKMTPYTLYMREHYVSLKSQCKDDKKAIFIKCNEMWESESEETKMMYARKCQEEIEDSMLSPFNNNFTAESPDIVDLDQVLEAKDALGDASPVDDEKEDFNQFLTNKALNLESAAQFASLVAAYHIDVSTRNDLHLDMSMLLERAMIFPHGLEEI